MINRVVILVAMEQEARPFIRSHDMKKMKPQPFEDKSPMVAFHAKKENCDVYLVWNGRDKRFFVNNVATVCAAVSTYASVASFKPDLVISAGTAGGFQSSGAKIGDVYISTKSVFHHRRIPGREDDSLEEYGFGHYRSPSLQGLVKSLEIKQGVVSTSDSLDCTAQDLALMRAEGASVKDMECAACAWVCSNYKIPFVGMKSVTDIVDQEEKTTTEQFYQNLSKASDNLQIKLTAMIKLVGGTDLKSWASMSKL